MNKKSIFTLSAAVIVAALTGGSWYTGKKVEQNYQYLVTKANQELSKLNIYGVQASFNDVKLERGIFSSDVSYHLAVTVEEETYQFKGQDKLYHGPFPLNRLAKANFLPVMVSSESRLSSPESLQHLFSDKDVLVAQTAISYNEQMKGEWNLAEVKSSEQFPIALSQSTSFFDLDKNGQGHIRFTVPSVKLQMPDAELQFELEQVEYRAQLKHHDQYAHLSLGEGEMDVKTYKIITPDVQFNMNNIRMNSDNQVRDAIYLSKGDFVAEMELLRTEQADKVENLGKIQFNVEMSTDALATNRLGEYANSPTQLEPDAFAESIKALFAKPFQFHLNDLAWENSKGKSTFALNIGTKGIELDNIGDFNSLLNMVEPSQLVIKLNIAALEQGLKQIISLNDHERENAAEIAKQEINSFVMRAKQSEIAKVDEEHIHLTLAIDQGKVKLNDTELTEQEIQQGLFMLMLGLGAL